MALSRRTLRDHTSTAEARIHDELHCDTNGLHATLVQKIIKRATDDTDSCVDRLTDGENTSKPEYDTSSTVYDRRAAADYRDNVSLAALNTRVECEYDIPDDHEAYDTASTC